MVLTAQQLESRRNHIGASDIAAILGEDEYRTPVDVWMEKRFCVSSETSEAAELGNHLEGACRTLAAVKLGTEVSSEDLFREVPDSPIAVNLDAWCREDGIDIPVECKTAGMLNPWGIDPNVWGDEWGDHVPARYILQTHGQMMACNAPHAYISALMPGRGHVMYQIPFNVEIADLIRSRCAHFWRCVESNERPLEAMPSNEVLERLKRIPDTCRAFDSEAADAILLWKAASKAEKESKDRLETAKAAVIARLGVAEAAVIDWDDSQISELAKVLDTDPAKAAMQTAVTYTEQTRASVDTSLLKSRFPDAYEACKKSSTFRTLRLKKTPKGLVVNVAADELLIASAGGAA